MATRSRPPPHPNAGNASYRLWGYQIREWPFWARLQLDAVHRVTGALSQLLPIALQHRSASLCQLRTVALNCAEPIRCSEPVIQLGLLTLARLAGVTCARCPLLGAKTPWKRVRLTRGLGTKPTRRAMS